MSEEEPSYFDDLQKIPCFKRTFQVSISSGILTGLATFIFTSRIKKATDFGVGVFAVSTLAYWGYCRRKWTKEHFMAQKMNSALHDVMMNEGKIRSSGPPQ